jgi:hypothetical protein
MRSTVGLVVEAIARGGGFAAKDARAARPSGCRQPPCDTALREYRNDPCVCRMDIGNGL